MPEMSKKGEGAPGSIPGGVTLSSAENSSGSGTAPEQPAVETHVEVPARGLYRKFEVRRVDRSPKHDDCEYFVLDWEHDPFTVPAVLAYADACEAAEPALAKDLRYRAKAPIVARPVRAEGAELPPRLWAGVFRVRGPVGPVVTLECLGCGATQQHSGALPDTCSKCGRSGVEEGEGFSPSPSFPCSGGCGLTVGHPDGVCGRPLCVSVRDARVERERKGEGLPSERTVSEGGAGRVTWKLSSCRGLFTGKVLVSGALAASFAGASSEEVTQKMLAFVDDVLDPRDTRATYVPPAVRPVDRGEVGALLALNALSNHAGVRLDDLAHRLSRVRQRVIDAMSEWLESSAGKWDELADASDVNPRMIQRARELRDAEVARLFAAIGGAL